MRNRRQEGAGKYIFLLFTPLKDAKLWRLHTACLEMPYMTEQLTLSSCEAVTNLVIVSQHVQSSLSIHSGSVPGLPRMPKLGMLNSLT